MIHIKNVSKIYNIGEVETKALDNVSFDIKKGEFVAIMGPSGQENLLSCIFWGLLTLQLQEPIS